jgi:hypothetical protein
MEIIGGAFLAFQKFLRIIFTQFFGNLLLIALWYVIFTYVIIPKLTANANLNNKYIKGAVAGIGGFFLYLLLNYVIMNHYISC